MVVGGAGPVWIRRGLGFFVEMGGVIGLWGLFVALRIIFGL